MEVDIVDSTNVTDEIYVQKEIQLLDTKQDLMLIDATEEVVFAQRWPLGLLCIEDLLFDSKVDLKLVDTKADLKLS